MTSALRVSHDTAVPAAASWRITGTTSAETRRLPSTRISSIAANQFMPPASRATFPSWPNGESTKAVGLRSVRIFVSLLAEAEDRLADRVGRRLRLALLEPAEPL